MAPVNELMLFFLDLVILNFAGPILSSWTGENGRNKISKMSSISPNHLNRVSDEKFNTFVTQEYSACLYNGRDSEGKYLFQSMMECIRDNDVDKYLQEENGFIQKYNVSPQDLKRFYCESSFASYVIMFGANNFLPILNIPEPYNGPDSIFRLTIPVCVRYLLQFKPLGVVVEMLSLDFHITTKEAVEIYRAVLEYYPDLHCFDLIFFAFCFDKEMKNIAKNILLSLQEEEKLQGFLKFLDHTKDKDVFEFLVNFGMLHNFPNEYPELYLSLDRKIKFNILFAVILENNIAAFMFALSNDPAILKHVRNYPTGATHLNVFMVTISSGRLGLVEYLMYNYPEKLVEIVPGTDFMPFLVAIELDLVEVLKVFLRYHHWLPQSTFTKHGVAYSFYSYAQGCKSTKILEYLDSLRLKGAKN